MERGLGDGACVITHGTHGLKYQREVKNLNPFSLKMITTACYDFGFQLLEEKYMEKNYFQR
jgi:hypothetical protein